MLGWRGKRGFVYPAEGVISAYTSSAHLPICILLPARASLSKRKSPSSEEHPHPLFPRYLGAGNISCRHNVLLFGTLRRRTFRYVNYCLRALPCLNENHPPRRSILTPFSPAVFAGGLVILRQRTCQYVYYCLRALPCLIAERYAFVCVSSPRGSRSCSDGGGGTYFGG